MPIRIRCPGCQQLLSISRKLSGKTVKCPKCETAMRIPEIPAAKPDETSDQAPAETKQQPESQPTARESSPPTTADSTRESAPPEADKPSSTPQQAADQELSEETPRDDVAEQSESCTQAEDEQTQTHDADKTATAGPLAEDDTQQSDTSSMDEDAQQPAAESAAESTPGSVLPISAEETAAWQVAKEPGEDDDFVLRGAESELDEMDLTPMVDVTFLLLIFFMITASFSMQKSLEVPPPDPDQQGAQQTMQTLEEYEEESIIVQIDDQNVISVDYEPLADPRDIVGALEDRRLEADKYEIVIEADARALHETVVIVIDAANAVGMQKIRVATTGSAET